MLLRNMRPVRGNMRNDYVTVMNNPVQLLLLLPEEFQRTPRCSNRVVAVIQLIGPNIEHI
ncbi:hypothetical protein D3C71_1998380 [compost metagenome]